MRKSIASEIQRGGGLIFNDLNISNVPTHYIGTPLINPLSTVRVTISKEVGRALHVHRK